jgi:sulfur carrier protein ThiS
MPTVALPEFVLDTLSVRPEGKGRTLYVPAVSLSELVRYFRSQHPRAAERIFTDSGELRKNVIVVLNDELVPRGELPEVAFSDTDEIALMMQFAGG